MKVKKIPVKDIDYVVLFANDLKKDPSLFKQQKSLLESQYKASKSLFKNMFGEGEEYKTNARKYLRKLEVIK